MGDRPLMIYVHSYVVGVLCDMCMNGISVFPSRFAVGPNATEQTIWQIRPSTSAVVDQ